MRPTNRVYKNIDSEELFRLYKDDNTHELCLINERTGNCVKNFVLSAFTPVKYKLQDKSVVSINPGEFMIVDLKNKPTHRKFIVEKRFVKI